MNFAFTGILAVYVTFILGAFVAKRCTKNTKQVLGKFIGVVFSGYVILAGIYSWDGYSPLNSLGAMVIAALTGMFIVPHQILEALLLLIGINEPTGMPNLFMEGPKSHWDR